MNVFAADAPLGEVGPDARANIVVCVRVCVYCSYKRRRVRKRPFIRLGGGAALAFGKEARNSCKRSSGGEETFIRG